MELVPYTDADILLTEAVMAPAAIEANRDLLAEFDTSKGTVRFTPDKPLPADLVSKLVRARMAETDAAAAKS